MTLSIPSLIEKKRDGLELSNEEIQFFVNSVVDKSMQDSQIGAMLMAIYINGMNFSETVELTRTMTHSGQILSFPEEWNSLLVDKHSTGGVGDKISLVLAPVLAAFGFKVPMVSGRGLGFTGGTLDKLESIPGFTTKLSNDQMVSCLESVGCFIAGATEALAPADAILYQQRDITNTVGCLPLIVSSILSKKVAESTKALVMDIKVGRGSFLKTEETARKIATMLVEISKGLGVDTKVVLSRMDCPIGYAVGNAVEVVEALNCLRGSGPEDLQQLVFAMGGVLLQMKGTNKVKVPGRVKTLEEGKTEVAKVITDGSALKCFFKMLVEQGVTVDNAKELCFGDSEKVFKTHTFSTTLYSKKQGYIAEIDALTVGVVCWKLGAGRNKASAPVDHSVGILLLVKPGDFLNQHQPWVKILHSTDTVPKQLQDQLEDGLVLVAESPNLTSPVIDIV